MIQKTKRYSYTLSYKSKLGSIALTAFIVFHRRYCEAYSSLPQVLRDYVDNYTNCEDILMNFLVANATGMGPILVESNIASLRNIDSGGLWHKSSHFGQRSECINYFVKAFGYNPLIYTTSFFPVNKKSIPSRKKYKASYKLPAFVLGKKNNVTESINLSEEIEATADSVPTKLITIEQSLLSPHTAQVNTSPSISKISEV